MENKLDFDFIYENCKTIGDLKKYIEDIEKLEALEKEVLENEKH